MPSACFMLLMRHSHFRIDIKKSVALRSGQTAHEVGRIRFTAGQIESKACNLRMALSSVSRRQIFYCSC